MVCVLFHLAWLVMLVILWLFFRKWTGMILPFLMVVLAIIPSMGLVVLFGWKVSILSLLVPVMLIAIANNYGIHIFSRFEQEPGISTVERVTKVVRSLRIPVLFTGITSVAGILGLLMHSITPARQVGILTALGIVWALLLSIFLLPGLLVMQKSDSSKHEVKDSRAGKRIEKLSDLIIRWPKQIIIVSAVLLIIGSAGIMFLKVDSNQENFFPAKHPVSVASRKINDSFGGSQGISVMIEGDIMDPALLRSLDSWKKENLGQNGVGSVISVADAIKAMSRGLYNSDEPGYNAIPSDRRAIAQMIELFNLSGDPDEFNELVNFSYTRAHLAIRLSNPSNRNIDNVIKSIEALGQTLDVKITIGGYATIMFEFAESIIRGQLYSLVYAILVIFLLLTVITRSIIGGMIASLPLLVSIVLMFGFMGLTGIPLDSATALLSSIMIGIGVDYTIHYLFRHREFVAAGFSNEDSVRKTVLSTGKGILYNGLSVMAGFSVLIFSGFLSIRYFGFLTVISIGTCLAGALILIPAILIIWDPPFIRK